MPHIFMVSILDRDYNSHYTFGDQSMYKDQIKQSYQTPEKNLLETQPYPSLLLYFIKSEEIDSRAMQSGMRF
jgi:hypothetical protein